MFLKKIKSLYGRITNNQEEILRSTKEVEWANVFHDSIKGYSYLKDFNLNIGRWAGGYPFFYCLNRILHDGKPKHILEFGLGESSKFISKTIDNELKTTQHDILEHNPEWSSDFNSKFVLGHNSNIIASEIVEREKKSQLYNSYSVIDELDVNKYDCFIVDGPIGTTSFSRYDIVTLVNQFNIDKDFIILFDDTNRIGEKETLKEMFRVFNEKGVCFYNADYLGAKSTTIITSERYKYLTSI